jgi:5'-3' exonuclease
MAKKKNYEITDEQYEKAIAWLDEGKTKKGACDILGVSNNKTMERLIEEHLNKKQITKEMRAKKRRTAVTQEEVVSMITDYINGYTLQDLADSYYRSVNIIKLHLEKNGAMLRVNESIDPLNPPVLPDECMADTFNIGQFVWSAKYGCVAQVKAEYKGAYRIQVLGNGRQESSYQPAWELGDLTHLENMGVKLSQFTDYMRGEDVRHTIAQTMREANKRAKK